MNNKRHYLHNLTYTFPQLKYKNTSFDLPVTTKSELQNCQSVDKDDFNRLDFDMAIAEIFKISYRLVNIVSVIRDFDNYTVTYFDSNFEPTEKKIVINLKINTLIYTYSVNMITHDDLGLCSWGSNSIKQIKEWWNLRKENNSELEIIKFSNTGEKLKTIRLNNNSKWA